MIRPPKPQLKVLPMAEASVLARESLAMALARLAAEPHDGWADLLVHPSRIRAAQVLAREHATGAVKVRILADTRMGIEGWELRSATAKVVNQP